MATIAEKCVEIYKQKLMIHQVAQETGLPWHVVYRYLKKAGALNLETRLVTGSATDRMGAFYEKEFQRLVPGAKSQNDKKKQYHFDFLVDEAKVEVKSSSLHVSRNRPYWKFEVCTRDKRLRVADFYVCFGKNAGDDPGDYTVFCFPSELLRGVSLSVNPDGRGEWAKFKIAPSELHRLFEPVEPEEDE